MCKLSAKDNRPTPAEAQAALANNGVVLLREAPHYAIMDCRRLRRLMHLLIRRVRPPIPTKHGEELTRLMSQKNHILHSAVGTADLSSSRLHLCILNGLGCKVRWEDRPEPSLIKYGVGSAAHLMLCRMVSLKRTVSWGTKPMGERKEA